MNGSQSAASSRGAEKGGVMVSNVLLVSTNSMVQSADEVIIKLFSEIENLCLTSILYNVAHFTVGQSFKQGDSM